MRSPSQHSFARVPAVNINRSVFKRDRGYKTTLDVGKLYPVYIDDVLPGDTFNVDITSFMRLTTPICPFMDNLVADFFFFFVPNRLVWENWQRFCGERDNPVQDYNNDASYLVPQLTPVSGSSFAVGSLADYFGLPTGVPNLSVDAMPFRAYNLIWNEFFRDENLQNSATVDIGDTTVDDTNYQVRRTNQRSTYFNRALPWPQKGPSVELPLGSSAPVYGTGNGLLLTDGTVTTRFGMTGGIDATALVGVMTDSANGLAGATSGAAAHIDTLTRVAGVPTKAVVGSGGYVTSGLYADLSSATAADINSIREAFQVQRWYERLAVGGSRYIEILRSMFGVVSPDARLQRPEYLGGGHVNVNVHSVAQTSSTDSTSPQGNLAAYGVAGGRVGFTKSFVEHGWVFGLVRIRADVTYQQGIDRMFSRRTRFDYYWPPFAHLGEQAILNKELYAQGSAVVDSAGNPVDENVFAYQERYAEYRYGISHVTGELRSTFAQSLDVWHLAYVYSSLPTLSSTFIEENPPISRVIAVQNHPAFIYDSLITCRCVRPMPVFGTPGLVDHWM